MNIFLLVLLRLIHIVAGILWGGAAVFFMFFVKPSVKSIGAAGPQFMQTMSTRRKLPLFMVSMSLLTVVAGGILLWYTSGGLSWNWITSGVGTGFTIGSLAALIAFLVGTFVLGPTTGQMGELGGKIAATGAPPSAEQIAQLKYLEKKLSIAEWVDFIMLAVAMITMATARYWIF